MPFDPTLLDRVPFLRGRGHARWQIESMGSVTNQTVRLTEGADSYVVRVAGPTTGYLNRDVETHNAAVAAALDLTPPILFLDETLLVTRFVAEARPLAAGDLEEPDTLMQIGAVLARLQKSDRLFRGERHPFGEIDRYLGQHTHPRAVALRRAAKPVEAALARAPRPLVPAHVDASAANFLLGRNGKLWLVDWEFSSMADPAWDPASVLMQRRAGHDALAHRFIAAIFGEASDRTMGRVGLFQVALCLVAGSWCAMEGAARQDSGLMQTADAYLDRCAALLAGPVLADWLHLVTEA